MNSRAPAVERAIEDAALAVPDILGAEVLAALRSLERRTLISRDRADRAMNELHRFPIRVWPTQPTLRAVWQLRHNLGIADACYVVLARSLGCPLLTTDTRLASAAPGIPIILAQQEKPPG